MKKYFIISLLIISLNSIAQIGIGTSSPDASAILDLSSTTKGFLMPRMTTLQQSNLVNPAVGLIVYNITTSQIETNKGDGFGAALWSSVSSVGTTAPLGTNTTQLATTAFVMENTGGYATVNSIIPTTSNSLTDILVADMIVSPPAGTYSVLFNSEYNNASTTTSTTTTPSSGTAQAVIDLVAANDQLMAIPVTDATHAPAMGSGETLFPGVYSFIAAASIAGTLKLDAQGNHDALFIFKVGGAFACGAITIVELINGAEARNVFWVSGGAPSLGAGSTMKGTMIAQAGAGAIGAGCNLEGRLFSMAGALTFGPAIASVPLGLSPINLGGLANFALFTSDGAVSNTAASTITGNIGTNLGAITGFEISTVVGSFVTSSTPIVSLTPITTTTITENNVNNLATFSIYQNGVLIPSSTKKLISNASTANLSLQSIASITEGQPIEVRWKTAGAQLSMGNRTLTVLKVK
ncbi:ice-binding family protein [Flavobacterium sp. W20_MBD1_R3]|uniref:ice-binding family protein n=1 Tax=Flavobacterium sp. W20_MBD1_R3 TaxID=3240278 RepID=UPI003F91D746